MTKRAPNITTEIIADYKEKDEDNNRENCKEHDKENDKRKDRGGLQSE